ncbi:MAG TPA: hypothetical protein PLK28_16240 [Candidatus Rifleibacterium sp.]|nr:hypothetical protein [Candidatus Rifleibacterium sp.]
MRRNEIGAKEILMNMKSKLESASETSFEDSKSDKELTAFSSLNFESFMVQFSKKVVAVRTQRSDASA